ncbi:hypothetical protein [Gemmatimonas groenlandica]|uniref:Tetratricopeptide repeat protein n=1 Tax=Gemmatimonas groenlandica TaxID=2732249 RepID=A0A6M4IKV3_9BACT|nr:hypothetical protein [Gemmatimonas groenlandica]QJR35353.1 hypothetical protein HKW67_07470 [Gemmatimonas groenlandica]
MHTRRKALSTETLTVTSLVADHRASRGTPHDAGAYHALGDSYFEQDRLDEATTAWLTSTTPRRSWWGRSSQACTARRVRSGALPMPDSVRACAHRISGHVPAF